jgi:cephalosporin hydroxylase
VSKDPRYLLRQAGSKLPDAMKAPAKVVWHRWGTFVANGYSRYYLTNARQTWMDTYWLGVKVLKNPMDLWVYQEIIKEVQPALVIETGTFRGGSAFYLASIMDLVGTGRIVTVDVNHYPGRPEHPRIEYVHGSSIDPAVLELFAERVAAADGPVIVLLDSAHEREHVLLELDAFHGFVTPGSYLIVEDTAMNGHPTARFSGPGPWEAVTDFLPRHPEFVPDRTREKFMHTWNPRGYLRRVAPETV